MARFRLHTLLILLFGLQITGAVGLVGYLSWRSGRTAVNTLATQLRYELTSRIDAELRKYIDSPHYFNQLIAETLARGGFDLDQGGQAQPFVTQTELSPYIYSTYCGDTTGAFLGAFRMFHLGTSTIGLVTNLATPERRFAFYRVDAQGQRGQLLAAHDPYDPRLRPWWEAAVKARTAIWSQVYLDFATGLPTITASLPVYDADDDLIGVCSTDVILREDLSHFLEDLSIGQTGQAFIVDAAGRMLASSTEEALTAGTGADQTLIQAVDSQDRLVRETARYLQQYSAAGATTYPAFFCLSCNSHTPWIFILTVSASMCR